MKIKKRKRIILGIENAIITPPNAKPDSDADKTGTDKDSDKTQLPDPKKDDEKFDKPKREPDPDRTDIDIQKARNETVKSSPKVPIKTKVEIKPKK